MTDTSFHGTGDELGRIRAGDMTIILEDDGDDDTHTYVRIEHPDGTDSFGRTGFTPRRREGDDWVVEQINAVGDSTAASSASTRTEVHPGPFICDGCGRTWPHARNQTPDGDDDTCPDCADD